MTVLSVNVNKIAVLRNSRGGGEPDVVRAGIACGSWRCALWIKKAPRMISKKLSIYPSLPRPTRTPAWSNSVAGAMPPPTCWAMKKPSPAA